MKKADIIVKGLLPYFKDKRNRSKNIHGECAYNGKNGKHCFVGQFLKPKYQKLGESFELNTSAYDGLGQDMCYKYFNNLGVNLIVDFQNFHDDNESWERRSETWIGLEIICNNHDLDFKYIKSELIKKCKK